MIRRYQVFTYTAPDTGLWLRLVMYQRPGETDLIPFVECGYRDEDPISRMSLRDHIAIMTEFGRIDT